MFSRHCLRATRAANAGVRSARLVPRASISTITNSTITSLPSRTRSTYSDPQRLLSCLSTRSYSTSPADSSSAVEKPDFLNEAESVIWDRLVAKFEPIELVVQDISGGCGSMYGIEICSPKFTGVSTLKQHRMVNEVLSDLMEGWHGVQLKPRAP